MNEFESGREYRISYKRAIKILEDANQNFLNKYPIRNIKLDETTNNSRIQLVPISFFTSHPKPKHLKYDCIIGIKCLSDNMDEYGYIRNVDLAYCVKHIAHEAQHLYRNIVTYQNQLLGYELDMARMDALSGCFRGYHDNTYFYLPSEIDAEIHGLLNTVKYFHSMKIDGKPIIDAKTCLYEKYKELKTNRVWYGQREVRNFDDMIKSLKDMRGMYLTEDRGFPLLKNIQPDAYYLKEFQKHSAWQDILQTKDRTGVQYDEKLFVMMVDLIPLWVQTHDGIKDEAKRLSQKYSKYEKFTDAVKELTQIKMHDEEQL